jgi:hypothetical protein
VKRLKGPPLHETNPPGMLTPCNRERATVPGFPSFALIERAERVRASCSSRGWSLRSSTTKPPGTVRHRGEIVAGRCELG